MTAYSVKTLLDDYAPGQTPGWEHTNEGHHIVVNGKFGTLEIGVVPGKSWDQWLFHENNGGGSLVIGYTLDQSGKLDEVMMLVAPRFNLVSTDKDIKDIELPGGFVDEGETKLNTAVRELLEETSQLAYPESVPGRGYVGNRAFFALDGEDEGTSVFAFSLAPEQVAAANASEKLVMMPWQDAIRNTRDALSGMAIARLLAQLS